jgi:hypothetical protein
MKTYGGNGGTSPLLLTSALDGCEWSASHPAGVYTETYRPEYERTQAVCVPQHYSGTVSRVRNCNSVTLVRERTIPTERLPLVGKVSANFCGYRVPSGQRNGSQRAYSPLSRPETLPFVSKKLLNCSHEAEWTPFLTHYFSENLVVPGIEPGPLNLQPGTLATRAHRRSTFFYITYINSVRTSQETQYISVI